MSLLSPSENNNSLLQKPVATVPGIIHEIIGEGPDPDFSSVRNTMLEEIGRNKPAGSKGKTRQLCEIFSVQCQSSSLK